MGFLQGDALSRAIRIRRKRGERALLAKQMVLQTLGLMLLLSIVFSQFSGLTIAKGNEMYPAIREGDVLLYERRAGHLNGEAVLYEHAGEQHLGRIEAVAGAVIDETGDHQITIDGNYQPVQERAGIFYRTYVKEGGALKLPLVIDRGAYFILCDNRERASDSRAFGPVPEADVRGRIIMVLRRRMI